MRVTASRPSPASPTTSIVSSLESTDRRPARMRSSSSTSTTRTRSLTASPRLRTAARRGRGPRRSSPGRTGCRRAATRARACPRCRGPGPPARWLPAGFVTPISSASAPYVSATFAPPSPWRSAFVSDSWRIRYAAWSTAGPSGRASAVDAHVDVEPRIPVALYQRVERGEADRRRAAVARPRGARARGRRSRSESRGRGPRSSRGPRVMPPGPSRRGAGQRRPGRGSR